MPCALDDRNRVLEIQVKKPAPSSNWVWGAFKMPGMVLEDLYDLWCARGRIDEYMGTLVNAWLALGGVAYGYRSGASYYDVGTMDGYLEAMHVLSENTPEAVTTGAL